MLKLVSIAATAAQLAQAQPWSPTVPKGPDNGGKSKAFPPGFNGEARTPPQGWRSWNAFGNRITQDMMTQAVDAVVAKNRTVAGWDGPVSLCDLGYCAVGVDEGWEGCGEGVGKTQHYANGTPAVNPKFPDLQELVDYGHSKKLKMGFYQNGCACGEHKSLDINIQGDVKLLHEQGWDAVKLDGCGAQRNMTRYAELMVETGKNYSIENCHWGRCTDSDDSSCPTTEWCPFNWYRSSGDINAGHVSPPQSPPRFEFQAGFWRDCLWLQGSWYANLQTTIRFQTWEAPVSQVHEQHIRNPRHNFVSRDISERLLAFHAKNGGFHTKHDGSHTKIDGLQPGCWAYPDMLEVGRVRSGGAGSEDPGWNRAHFGAWCIVSAPLVLGMDLTDEKLVPVLDVIGNKLALGVNQDWAGHPGSLVRTLPPAPPPAPTPAAAGTYAVGAKCEKTDATQNQWSILGDSIKHGEMCLDAKDKTQLRLVTCDATSATQKFTQDPKVKGRITVNGGKGCLDIYGSTNCMPLVDRRVDIFGCNGKQTNQLFEIDGGSLKANCGECLAARKSPASGGGKDVATDSQLWAKPLSKGAAAALFINGGDSSASISIHLKELNMTATGATVQDVWTGAVLGKTTDGSFMTPMINGTDSAFLIFTPTAN